MKLLVAVKRFTTCRKREVAGLISSVTDNLYLSLLPLILPILLTIVMFLPADMQTALKFNIEEPSLWQYLTNVYVHENWSPHYLNNMSTFLALLIPQIIIVAEMKEKKRYNWLLLSSLLFIPPTTWLLESGTPIYNNALYGDGFSGIVFAMIGFAPILLLAYLSKVIRKNLLSLRTFFLLACFIIAGFLIEYYPVYRNVFLIIPFAAGIALSLGSIIYGVTSKDGWNSFKRSGMAIICDYWKRILNYILLAIPIVYFLCSPFMLLPKNFLENGEVINFMAHLCGLFYGMVLCFVFFHSISYKRAATRDDREINR